MLTTTFEAWKHRRLDLPCSVDFLLDMHFDSSGTPEVVTFSQASSVRSWKSYLTKDEQKPEQQRKSQPVNAQDIEQLLTRPVELSSSNSAEQALGLLQQMNFDLRCHAFYTHPSPDIPAEESKEPSQDMSYCFVDDLLSVSDFSTRVPSPAKTYPFELDDFQKRAILRLEEGENVFVAAHTSAGKTVVAEYAIALSKQHLTRVFYTSPTKALSNQKYREFKDLFGEVGLLTGDVSVDTESFCLVMTTEVLRSMLYQDSPKIRDLEWVIVDEVHYINDSDRGVVWEEVLIMLPSHVHVVMLSATVPNFIEFTEWVGRIRKQRVYVQCTAKRPVPLVHSAYMLGNLVPILDTESNYSFSGYSRIAREIENRMNQKSKKKRGSKDIRKIAVDEDCRAMKLVQDLRQMNLLPCVIFAFSKVKADSRAKKLTKCNLLDGDTRTSVRSFIDKALTRLKRKDRDLPQVQMVTSLLLEGIGVHHSGILPLLREMVEILFSRGVIKVLVATETFSLGLNMPTKTVIFSDIRKFDGSHTRYLQPGEYTQMAGRAGRRGIDEVGHVILLIKDNTHPPPPRVVAEMMQAQPLSLTSKFRLRYNMVTSLLMNEAMDVRTLMNRSYRETIPSPSNSAYLTSQISSGRALVLPEFIETCSEMARLLKINTEGREFNRKSMTAGAVVLIVNAKFAGQEAIVISAGDSIKCVALAQSPSLDVKCEDVSYSYESVKPTELLAVYRAPPKTKFSLKDGTTLMKESVQRHFKHILDARRGPRLTSKQLFREVSEDRDALVDQILTSALLTSPERHEQLRVYLETAGLEQQLLEDTAQGEDQYDCMVAAMKHFSLLDANSTLALKGRSIAPLANPYCLQIGECLFRGLLRDLNATELPAFLSVFVSEGRSDQRNDWSNLSPGLNSSLHALFALHNEVLDLENYLKVDNEMTKQLATSLIEPVFLWASGVPLREICSVTDTKEGNLVRTVIRTHELLSNLLETAVMTGDYSLKLRLEKAKGRMRREIVFATSLYVTE
jgi:antiviral helicase SKI2